MLEWSDQEEGTEREVVEEEEGHVSSRGQVKSLLLQTEAHSLKSLDWFPEPGLKLSCPW